MTRKEKAEAASSIYRGIIQSLILDNLDDKKILRWSVMYGAEYLPALKYLESKKLIKIKSIKKNGSTMFKLNEVFGYEVSGDYLKRTWKKDLSDRENKKDFIKLLNENTKKIDRRLLEIQFNNTGLPKNPV